MKKLSLEKLILYSSGIILIIAILIFIYASFMPKWQDQIDVDNLLPEQYLTYCVLLTSGTKTNLDKNRFVDVEYDKEKDKYYLWIVGDENLTTNMTKSSYLKTVSGIFRSIFTIHPDKIDNKDVDIIVLGAVQDKYGNTSTINLMQITLNQNIANKINWDNFNYNDLLDISKQYWLHDTFK